MSIGRLAVLCAGILAFNLVAGQETEEKSAEELARELANPNTPLASIKFKMQHRRFTGDLPGVDGETSNMVLFQPTL